MTLSLKTKTNIAFFLALAALATMGWFSFRESRRLAEKDQWVSHTRDILELAESLRSHISDAGTARRVYLLGDPKQLSLFNAANDAALSDFDALRKLTFDNPSQENRLARLEPLVRDRLSILRASIDLHAQTPNDHRQQEALTDQGTKLTAQFVELIHEFTSVERDLLQRRTSEAEASDHRATRINAFLTLSVFLLLIVTLALLNRELSRRARAERLAAEQKNLLQSILNSCSDAVTVADRSGNIILRNPVAARDTGNTTVDVLSPDYPRALGLYHKDMTTLYEIRDLPLARASRGEFVNGMEVYIRPPDGTQTRWGLAAGGPLLDNNGEQRGGVVFLRDITDRKEADERLSAALRESEADVKERADLSNFADLLQSCQTVEEACRVSERALLQIFGSRPGALCLTNASRNLVESVAAWHDCSTTEDVFDPKDCWALRLGRPYSGGDANSPLRCSHVSPSLAGDYLCVPLAAQGETLGVLYIEDTLPSSESSAERIDALRKQLHRRATAVAERISLALANLRLREVLRNQSIRDPLTGLFNRRYLEESLVRELHRATRTGRKVSFVMLDLDHFKAFNDSFGHQAGDLLLREAAEVIKARVRAGDLACRYGGEEFALILSEADTEGAQVCMEKIRDAVRHLSLQYRGETLRAVTVSVGIATFPLHADNPEELIRAADGALYQAKEQGRDRIVTCKARDRDSALANPSLST